jgi:hypothetical protein
LEAALLKCLKFWSRRSGNWSPRHAGALCRDREDLAHGPLPFQQRAGAEFPIAKTLALQGSPQQGRAMIDTGLSELAVNGHAVQSANPRYRARTTRVGRTSPAGSNRLATRICPIFPPRSNADSTSMARKRLLINKRIAFWHFDDSDAAEDIIDSPRDR